MSTYADDLRLALSDQFSRNTLRESDNSDRVLLLLSKRFPTSGSKINWNLVPEAVVRYEPNASIQTRAFTEFFDEISLQLNRSQLVFYVGDGATDILLE